jgi:hypothetical protein
MEGEGRATIDLHKDERASQRSDVGSILPLTVLLQRAT